MKKLLTGFALLFVAAMIHAAGNDHSKAMGDKMMLTAVTFNDTVPTDTTKKDSLQYGLLAYNVKDTVPTDTTKKDTTFASAVAYHFVNDTVPTDTTKKDTTFQALAYNK